MVRTGRKECHRIGKTSSEKGGEALITGVTSEPGLT